MFTQKSIIYKKYLFLNAHTYTYTHTEPPQMGWNYGHDGTMRIFTFP